MLFRAIPCGLCILYHIDREKSTYLSRARGKAFVKSEQKRQEQIVQNAETKSSLCRSYIIRVMGILYIIYYIHARERTEKALLRNFITLGV